MKKEYIFILILFLFGCLNSSSVSMAQNKVVIDSLEKKLSLTPTSDTTYVNITVMLMRELYAADPEKAERYAKKGIAISQQLNFGRGEVRLLYYMGMLTYFRGDNVEAINYFLKSQALSEAINDTELIGANLSRVGDINREEGNYIKAEEQINKAVSLLKNTPNQSFFITALFHQGLLYLYQSKFEKALSSLTKALVTSKNIKDDRSIAVSMYYIAEVYLKQQQYEKATDYYYQSLKMNQRINNLILLASTLNNVSRIHLATSKMDSAIFYSSKALRIAKKVDLKAEVMGAYNILYRTYQMIGKTDSALHYQTLWVGAKDTLFNEKKNRQIFLLQYNAQKERDKIEIEKQKIEIKNKNILLYASILVIVFVLSIIAILYKNNIAKAAINQRLEEKKEEIEVKNQEIETQNEELHQHTEELIAINHNLEKKNKVIEVQNTELRKQKEELEKINGELKIRDKKISEQNTELAQKQVKMIEQNVKLFQSKKEIEVLKNNLEDIVRQRTRELSQTLDNLTKQNQDLEQFSYIISHNLRAPVARILGLVGILGGDNVNENFRPELQAHLKKATTDLDTVIKDLSQIISIRADLNKTKEEIDILAVIDQQNFLLKDEIEKAQATIDTQNVNIVTLFSVKVYVQSIVQNLLSNAIKYKATKREPRIYISTEQVANSICLSVRDNGVGIDLENINTYKIFGLYQRMHDHVEGKGLGLFLVKTQIESLGGKIEIESKLDVGTTFKVYFPLTNV